VLLHGHGHPSIFQTRKTGYYGSDMSVHLKCSDIEMLFFFFVLVLPAAARIFLNCLKFHNNGLQR
jgi:hypothetical protein